MKKTAIIGLGVTGMSCLRWLYGRDLLTVVDTRVKPPYAGVREDYPDARYELGVARFDFSGFDRAVLSPGVALDSCLAAAARASGVELVSDIDLFCEAAAAPIYAITGTNGKSTVTSLVGHLLAAADRRPGVGGNVGDAALDVLADDRDCYVLELSSFQLERMAAHHFRAATVLNVTEDHLDRHGSFAGYAASKQHIYADCALAVANRDDPATLPQKTVPELVTFGSGVPDDAHWGISVVAGRRWLSRGRSTLMLADELPFAGRHNEQNALAACALVAAEVDPGTLAAGLKTFAGLPHRCQLVAERGGVRFINDSKATNVGATLAAVAGLADAAGPRLILIAGGDGKGADFAPLRGPVARHCKAVVLLGRDAPRLADALAGSVAVLRVPDMATAVGRAAALAEPGDVVLLSPACASLDMFSNFAERGDAFAAAVAELEP